MSAISSWSAGLPPTLALAGIPGCGFIAAFSQFLLTHLTETEVARKASVDRHFAAGRLRWSDLPPERSAFLPD